ncbi:MAG: N-formylglutamate amidohydrolase, partial [Methanomicrobiales archaeon]|nr:N-formylglutamate amidohydrolase [Methanomicrobiales archaeon]
GIPWIQIEVSRALYETGSDDPATAVADPGRARDAGALIWTALARFWDELAEEGT